MKAEPKQVQIQEDTLRLQGILTIPTNASGFVLFAHGSGSGRLSPRNQKVAADLNESGLATLLFDLLTEQESEDRNNVFDIPLLADRLVLATNWVSKNKNPSRLPIGYFGASTGAAAAIDAAARLGKRISAIVSRGGRPDLAFDALDRVVAPTLLIVGGNDIGVIELNQAALKRLSHGELIIVTGASHLFEEPGTLTEVSLHAANWFNSHFGLADKLHKTAS